MRNNTSWVNTRDRISCPPFPHNARTGTCTLLPPLLLAGALLSVKTALFQPTSFCQILFCFCLMGSASWWWWWWWWNYLARNGVVDFVPRAHGQDAVAVGDAILGVEPQHLKQSARLHEGEWVRKSG